MHGDTLQPGCRRVVIAGFGRSGSNLVATLFDLHERTLCRNEPNELRGGAFSELNAFFPEDLPDAFQEKWGKAVAQTPLFRGDRDALPVPDWKTYLRRGPVASRIAWLESRRRLRRFSGMRGQEWRVSPLAYRVSELEAALPVFKILLVPETIREAHKIDTGLHVIHVLRRPQDFLASWYNRYVLGKGGGPDRVLKANNRTLPRILEHFGADPARAHATGETALLESELWRWRYVNERIAELKGPRFLHIDYREAKTESAFAAARLHRFVGLETNEAHSLRAAKIENRNFAKPHAERLPSAAVDRAVSAVIDGSPLAALI